MIKKKTIIIFLLPVVLVMTILLIYATWLKKDSFVIPESNITEEERTVRGNSLEGIIESGEVITALFGYYDSNEVQRDDIILYSYAGSEDPLIKVVKGISGDSFRLEELENGWQILINGEILKNSKEEPYLLDEGRYKMLSLYEIDYQGVIPKDTYLVMGNIVGGTTDSTRHGLIHKTDILGKVKMP